MRKLRKTWILRKHLSPEDSRIEFLENVTATLLHWDDLPSSGSTTANDLSLALVILIVPIETVIKSESSTNRLFVVPAFLSPLPLKSSLLPLNQLFCRFYIIVA